MHTITIISTLLSATLSAQLHFPPKDFQSYPSFDQSVMISGALLTDPVLLETIEYVNSKVRPALLALKPSKYNEKKPNEPDYPPEQKASACYWPCVRNIDTADFKADISSCDQDSWGLSYDDGPSKDPKAGTEQLLNTLSSANIKATFFTVGSNAIRNKDILTKIDKQGHQLAVQYI